VERREMTFDSRPLAREWFSFNTFNPAGGQSARAVSRDSCPVRAPRLLRQEAAGG
jgi:hypothetical protein